MPYFKSHHLLDQFVELNKSLMFYKDAKFSSHPESSTLIDSAIHQNAERMRRYTLANHVNKTIADVSFIAAIICGISIHYFPSNNILFSFFIANGLVSLVGYIYKICLDSTTKKDFDKIRSSIEKILDLYPTDMLNNFKNYFLHDYDPPSEL